MNVTQRLGVRYTPRKPSVEDAIKAKMKVLREFYVVDEKNNKEIEERLRKAVRQHPGEDYEVVLDREARPFINGKLSGCQ